jgi:predicted MFS family arabinose efflux permease
MITLIGGGILFIVLGQMKTLPLICLFTFLVSFVAEAFRPANSTAIAFYSKEENRTRSYALNRLAINIGWALGSAVGGVLAKINYELLFWVDGFTNISAAIVMAIFLKPVAWKNQQESHSIDSPARHAFRDKTFMIFISVTALFACCFFQIFTNLPVFFKKHFQLSEPFIGLMMAINGIIIALVEMILVYKLEGRRRNMVYITAGVTLVGISFALLNIPAHGAFIAFVMIILITFGEILSMPFMNSYWITRTHTSNRGQYAALYTMAWSAAQTLGPMSGAQIAEHFGFNVLWITVAGVSFIAAYSFHRLK